MSTKTCHACARALPVEAFGIRVSAADGLAGTCRLCERDRQAIRKHGMTATDKVLTVITIDGCAICGRTEPGQKGWVVDHDRTCCPGDASCPSCRRGVLCGWCNAVLGHALDNPTTLRRAADYLELGTRVPELEPDSDSDPGSESDL